MPPRSDRVEQFLAELTRFEPTGLVAPQDECFRQFARSVSRNIDARLLERHPPADLLPDLQTLYQRALVRLPRETKLSVTVDEVQESRRAVLTVCMEDEPFILSTVLLWLEQSGIRRRRYIASIVPVSRDERGEVAAVGLTHLPKESFIWVELDLPESESIPVDILRSRLELVRRAVADFSKVAECVRELATCCGELAKQRPDQRAAHQDNAQLLRWLLDDNFVFMGTRYLAGGDAEPCHPVGNHGSGSFTDPRAIQIENAERAVLETGGIPPYLWIRKSRTLSCTYRSVPLDHILVQCWDPRGRPAGLLVLEGMFSFQALAQPRTSVPQLRRVVERVYTQLRVSKGSHRYRTIRNAFNSLPIEYLFSLQIEDVRQTIEQMLETDADQRLHLHIVSDELQDHVLVFIALPRANYADELRTAIRQLLRATYQTALVDDGVFAGDPTSVIMHFFLTGARTLQEPEVGLLREAIEQMASPWTERLRAALAQEHGEAAGRKLHGRYGQAFSLRYRESTSIARAVRDIALLETLGKNDDFDCDFYREADDNQHHVTRLRMFQTSSVLLSDILPVLDNLGLVVIDQFPTTVQLAGGSERVVATFRIRGDGSFDLLTRKNRLRAAIRAVMLGAMENHLLNRVLLAADIPWDYVELLRAYQTYARQIGSPFTFDRVRDAMEQFPQVVRALAELFRTRFDPTLEGAGSAQDETRRDMSARAQRNVAALLDSVEDLSSDMVLRTLMDLMQATVRTNFFARDALRTPAIVVKLDPALVPRMPEPLPFREIYVHHPQMLGLHLRGGAISRGGIRWSDRRLDFRTEVLGLMSTQNLKNAVIVPRGAKGTFVLRQPSKDDGERRRQADAMYRVFIASLLSVTDNLVSGKARRPEHVLCYDAEDPYLVVAADKGTAHLSDTANAVAHAHGFWLGDAFASGGSKGYDHKKEAITARGAWECIKRHFRELGLDPEKDPIRVAGIGDMSGDVFGNGMLCSHTLRLVAAFDHRHIFIDPSPDPEASFAERQRLFRMPGSTWKQYDPTLISRGGGIYDRAAKAITLSPEAQEALQMGEARPSGNALVRAILMSPVDLLWNGGIGTYIKSGEETHLEAGDAANDAVRVDAPEVRARVIGEGGNLGITQFGRVDLALMGVRLNSDATDNSAGVDLSDHEVNLKILMQGRSTLAEHSRDAWLERVREEVCNLVLTDNAQQSRMISLDALRAREDLARFDRAMDFLCERLGLRRRAVQLPSSRRLQARQQEGKSLTRPELALLASLAKQDLRQELSAGADTAFDCGPWLRAYFPASIAAEFATEMKKHPLARSIAHTTLTNHLLQNAGASWIAEVSGRARASTQRILEAHALVSDLLSVQEAFTSIEATEATLPAEVEYRARLALHDAVDAACVWQLRRNHRFEAAFRRAFGVVQEQMADWLGGLRTERLAQRATEWNMLGLPRALSDKLATLEIIEDALDVAALSSEGGVPPQEAARAFLESGSETFLLGIIRDAAPRPGDVGLERPARLTLLEQLRTGVVQLASRRLRGEGPALQTLAHELKPFVAERLDLPALVLAADRVARALAR
jgi:glutamate dehydrogenase